MILQWLTWYFLRKLRSELSSRAEEDMSTWTYGFSSATRGHTASTLQNQHKRMSKAGARNNNEGIQNTCIYACIAGKEREADECSFVLLPPPLAQNILLANKEVGAEIPGLTLLRVVKSDSLCTHRAEMFTETVRTLTNVTTMRNLIVKYSHIIQKERLPSHQPTRYSLLWNQEWHCLATNYTCLVKSYEYCGAKYYTVQRMRLFAYRSQLPVLPSHWEILRTGPSGA